MSKGTYEEFRDALRAFESGWDRARYETGRIQDWQLNQWAGGTVDEFYPGVSSWGDLTDEQWDAMSYRSMNSLGFVGYQFGEALLIDLGYYDDDQFYGNGASTNTWDGTWTGKNGVNSLEEFMTKEAQEIAIQEAFGFNLKILQEGLGNQGKSLDDFIGTTTTYQQDGQTVTVELTLTGIMAAAHLRGAYGTLNLLLNGSVSTDEYGTSILRYIDQFGGYDGPEVDEAIAFFEDRTTGDEGLGTPDGSTGGSGGTGGSGDGDGGSDGGSTGGSTGGSGGPVDGFDNSAITKANADVVVTWAYGSNTVVSDFDPASSTLFIDWVGADALDITETAEGIVFAIPSNNQTLTLAGVALDQLDANNINVLDATARSELAGLVGDDSGSGDGSGDGSGSGDGHGGGDGSGDGHGGGDGSGNGDGHGDGSGDGDGHGGGDGHGDGHGGGDGGHTHMHVTITYDSPAQVIDGFMPGMGDVIEISSDIDAGDFEIFEESGDALGLTVRVAITDNGVTTQTVFTGFGLADLTIANFSADNQGVLNEIAAVLGTEIVIPDTGGYTLTYDTDGSNPPATTGVTDEGGVKYKADSNADDIVGFDPAKDQIDVGGTSVHGMIVTKSEAGEIVIDSPWSDAAQIVQGVTYQDVTIDTFGVVGNEHFRQDMGGVVSWEQGVGPRDADTVYVRSHEYGVHEVVNDFDPSTMKISFLYFGTRERLSVEDTDAGLVISSLPSGQSVTFTGVTKADLVPGRVEFHFDQVMEDNLEVPFGFDQNDVTLVDRTMLLTPEAPAGQTTDGFQTRIGDMGDGAGGGDTGGGDTGGGDTGGGDTGGGDTGGGDTGGGDTGGGNTGGNTGGDEIIFGGGVDTVELTWAWAKQSTIVGFNADEDVIDFNALGSNNVQVTEADGDLVFEVVGNGGNYTTLQGIQAEDLSAANLTADSWNDITGDNSGLMQQLVNLGFDLG